MTNDQPTTAIVTSHVTNESSTTTPTPEPTTKRPNIYCTVDEYAERLHVSRGTVHNWVRAGLPSFVIGRTRRIVTERADRWLEAGGADRHRTSVRSKRRTSGGRDSTNPQR